MFYQFSTWSFSRTFTIWCPFLVVAATFCRSLWLKYKAVMWTQFIISWTSVSSSHCFDDLKLELTDKWTTWDSTDTCKWKTFYLPWLETRAVTISDFPWRLIMANWIYRKTVSTWDLTQLDLPWHNLLFDMTLLAHENITWELLGPKTNWFEFGEKLLLLIMNLTPDEGQWSDICC